ncbi:MAG TPA: LCP family protein [Candidatus Limnocylindria bacterium]
MLAAVLSFLLPGLGHGFLGATRRGLVLALPVLVLAGYVIGTVVVEGRFRALGLLLQPGVLIALLVLNLALLGWRIGAIVDAFLLARRRWPAARRRGQRIVAGVVLGALLATTFGMHVGLGYLGLKTYDTVGAIFATPQPTASPTSGASQGDGASPTATPVPTPLPTPVPAWSDDGRLDLLLVGGDAGPGRWSLRTDTMIVLSVDIASGRAAMFGIPRNMKNVPLPDGPAAAFPACDCYPDLINSLYVYAGQHPELFRGGEDRGYYALQDAVSELVDRQLDGMVVVTLNGFVRLVDALGGLDIYTPYNLYDASYPHEDGVHHEVVWIPAGQHHFDGHTALAFARSRHQDSDYDRMYRQQLVLTAMRRQVCPSDLVLRIPELLDIARDSLWTNVPVDQMPDLLELGSHVRVDRISTNQFWPPDIPETLTPAGIGLIRQMVADAFARGAGGSSAGASGSAPPTATPPDGC